MRPALSHKKLLGVACNPEVMPPVGRLLPINLLVLTDRVCVVCGDPSVFDKNVRVGNSLPKFGSDLGPIRRVKNYSLTLETCKVDEFGKAVHDLIAA
jgi:hypothetical protein